MFDTDLCYDSLNKVKAFWDGKLFRITQENGSRKALVFLTIEEMEKLFDFVVHVPDIEMDFGYRIKLEEAPE